MSVPRSPNAPAHSMRSKRLRAGGDVLLSAMIAGDCLLKRYILWDPRSRPMKKPVSARLARNLMNIAPCINSSSGRVLAISEDFRQLRVRHKHTRQTHNQERTIYGGSMFSAIDPFFMLM